MKKLVSCVFAGLTLNYAFATVSCSSDPSRKEDTEVAGRGTLKMELETLSESGKVYRLRQALFFVDPIGFGGFEDLPVPPIGPGGVSDAGPSVPPIEGGAGSPFDSGAGGRGMGGAFPSTGGFLAAGGTLGAGGQPGSGSVILNSEEDPDSPVLETFLPENDYQMVLVDGWFIEQVDRLLGTAAFVDATLLNSPFQFFAIESNEETFVQYEFEVDGERVVFGPPGRLIVGIEVHERDGGAAGCGNGRIDRDEFCDTFDFGGETCASLTLGAEPFGVLQCTGDCIFDTSECFGGFDGGVGGSAGGGGLAGF